MYLSTLFVKSSRWIIGKVMHGPSINVFHFANLILMIVKIRIITWKKNKFNHIYQPRPPGLNTFLMVTIAELRLTKVNYAIVSIKKRRLRLGGRGWYLIWFLSNFVIKLVLPSFSKNLIVPIFKKCDGNFREKSNTFEC